MLVSHRGSCDVAAYALGALEPAEADAFRAHVETCIVCSDELVVFQAIVNVLAATPAQHSAPRRLRRRILDTIEHENTAALRAERRVGAGPGRQFGRLRPARLPRLVPALSAIVATVAIAVAIAAVELHTASKAGTRVFAAHVTGSGSADITVSADRAQLIVHDFSAPPAGEIYEVWLLRPGRSPTATNALFSVTANGDGDVEVPGNLQGVRSVMVTPEPAGGTRRPTHPAVIRVALS